MNEEQNILACNVQPGQYISIGFTVKVLFIRWFEYDKMLSGYFVVEDKAANPLIVNVYQTEKIIVKQDFLNK